MTQEQIRENIETVRETIARAAERAGRDPKDVTLIAVTKTVSAETAAMAVNCGVRDVGENRVQEYRDKRENLPPEINVHFIGQLQRNKVKYIVSDVAFIHSVDRLSLAEEINRQALRHEKIQDVLIEVNTDPNGAKGGVDFDGIVPLAEEILKLPNVRVKGLMTVMPIEKPEGVNLYEKMYGVFQSMKTKLPETDWRYLSMGMSGDFEEALKNGSDMIRLGRAFFGERNYDKQRRIV